MDSILERETQLLEALVYKYRDVRVGREAARLPSPGDYVVKALAEVALRAHRVAVRHWRRCREGLLKRKRHLVGFHFGMYRHNAEIKRAAVDCIGWLLGRGKARGSGA